MSNFTRYSYEGYEIEEDSDIDEIDSEHSNDEFDNIERLQDRVLANEIDNAEYDSGMIYDYLQLAEKSFQSMASKTAFNHQNLIRQNQSSTGNDQSNPISDTRNAAVINDNTEKTTPTTSDQNQAHYYDDIYFDSDSEQWQMKPEGDAGRRKKKVRKLSNDELLYDPNIDEDNEIWAKSQKWRTKQSNSSSSSKETSQSDLVLSCPSCMSILCRDCQRHETYSNQFRAMFVSNCTIVAEQTLRYSDKKQSRRGKKKRNTQVDNNTEKEDDNASSVAFGKDNEIYHPVQCAICYTDVAVYDKDEVYHFFHVIEGIS